MRACLFCKTRYRKGSGVTFHRFPTDSTRQIWLKNMHRENWNPKSCDHLCSLHFTEDCFIIHASRTQLKRCSIPTLFSEKLPLCDDNAAITPCVSETAEVEVIMSRVDTCLVVSEASTSASEENSRTMPEVHVKVEHDYHENTPARSVSEMCTNIRHDHYYEISPRSTEKKMQKIKKSLEISRARVKVLTQHVKRLKITIATLKKDRVRKSLLSQLN